MLKLAGESDIGLEKIESIKYSPDPQATNDLEAGTNTITATAEASGTGNADYNASLTLAKPDDARLLVKRIAAGLAVTIDSMTAGHLYCRVYVDSQDANHRLFDEDWTSTGAKLDAVDTYSGALSTIFDALSDGASHTFYFFFWVDSGNAVISVVQLWEAVGSCRTSGYESVLDIAVKGLASMFIGIDKQGTGSPTGRLIFSDTWYWIWSLSGNSINSALVLDNHRIALWGTVSTDINYMYRFQMTLRSEQ